MTSRAMTALKSVPVQGAIVGILATQVLDVVSTVVVGVSVPKPISRIAVNRIPRIRLTLGPPSMITTRFQTASW